MIATRWRKVLNDVRLARGRFLALWFAMSLSLAAVTALLVSQAILSRELTRSFLRTRPASAILHMDAIDEELVRIVRTRPGISAAAASAAMSRKIQTKAGDWIPLQLTVVADFESLDIDVFEKESGAWPAPPGAMLIERSGVELLGMQLGDSAITESFAGVQHALGIAGVVHDETRPPSTQEIAIYGYITPTTMSLLEPERRLDQLKIRVMGSAASAAQIEAVARPLAAWLRDQGRRVHLVSIPPPGEHPHQWQYESISGVLLAFAILGWLLTAILLAIVVASVLAPQVRQVAVMKAIGAQRTQVAAMYLTLVGALGAAAVLAGIPLGMLVGRTLVGFVARIVNVDIADDAIAVSLIALCASLGIAVPLIAALLPVIETSRKSVREALDDHGIARTALPLSLSARFDLFDATTRSAIRHALIHRRRLALVVTLLSVAGLMFVLAGSLLRTWQHVAASADAQRRYDLQVWLRDPLARAHLSALANLEGIARLEPIDSHSAYLDRGDAIPVAGVGRTSFAVRFSPADTTLFQPRMAAGRWLQDDDVEAVVINSVAQTSLFPDRGVGDSIALLVNGRPIEVRIVGIVTEPLTSGAAYAAHALLDRISDSPGRSQGLRIALASGHAVQEVLPQIKAELARAGAVVSYISTRANSRRAEDAHVYVLVALLGVVVMIIACVGASGLLAALGTSVVQRTREIGIMRAIGASSAQINKSVLAEAAVAAALSWVLTLVLSIPATIISVEILRRLAFQTLAVRWSIGAALMWLVIVLAVAAAASWLPARRAARLSVAAALKQG